MKQISWVQRIANNASGVSATSVTITLAAGISTTAGNTLILHSRGSGGATVSAVSDGKNTWVSDLIVGTTATLSIWRCFLKNPLVAGDQIQITYSASSTRALAIHEFTGISNVLSVDKTASNHGGSGTALSASVGPTGSLVVPSQLIFTAVATNQNTTYTVPSGYSPLDTGLTTQRTTYAAYLLDANKTAKSVTWNWGASGTWSLGIVTYEPFSSGGVNLLSGVG